MFTVRLEPHDFEDIDQLFAALDAHLSDLTPVMQDLGEFLTQSTKDRFPEGAAPDGTAWAPKSQVTMDAYRRREAKGPNATIDFRPLFGPSGRLSTEIYYEAGPNHVQIGSALPYAGVMQFGAAQGAFGRTSRGAPIPWGDIPARPFLGISEDDRVGITEILQEYLDGIVTAAG